MMEMPSEGYLVKLLSQWMDIIIVLTASDAYITGCRRIRLCYNLCILIIFICLLNSF